MSATDGIAQSKRSVDDEERSTVELPTPPACLARHGRSDSRRAGQAANGRSDAWICSCGHEFRDAVVHDHGVTRYVIMLGFVGNSATIFSLVRELQQPIEERHRGSARWWQR